MGSDYVKWIAAAIIGYWIWKNTNIGSSLDPRGFISGFTSGYAGTGRNVRTPVAPRNSYFRG